MGSSSKITQYRLHEPNVARSLRKTIKLIALGINEGSAYLPLRNHVAQIAAQSAPKDYFDQARRVYQDFVKRWRYVPDPLGFETVCIAGPTIWAQIWGADYNGRGWGDCDDATVGMGAALAAIGRPVRIVTIAGPKTANLLAHVYLETQIPGAGWIAVDPVGFPRHAFGWRPPARRVARWDLAGRPISRSGKWPKNSAPLFAAENGQGEKMEFRDYGLETVGMAGIDEPLDWSKFAVKEFGAYSPMLGLIGDASSVMMAVEPDDYVSGDLVVTKMMELSPDDYRHAAIYGAPRIGCVALADDGEVYQYQHVEGLGGFFKRLFKKIKKGVKKVASKIRSVARKLIKKLPGGKYLLKIAGKIRAIAKKLVRPLMKFVGKYAAKLAPIAALIPGYGPAIAGALYMAGKIAKIATKVGVVRDKVGRLIFKSPKHAAVFKAELKKAAQKEKVKHWSSPQARRDRLARLARAVQAAHAKQGIRKAA